MVRSLNRNGRISARMVDRGLGLLLGTSWMSHNPLDAVTDTSFSESESVAESYPPHMPSQ